jgi:hypothetical protein
MTLFPEILSNQNKLFKKPSKPDKSPKKVKKPGF